MKTFLLKSMGCKSNQFEGAIIEENLINAGFDKVNDIKDADLFILNSCSVTHKSDDEALYLIRHAKHTNENIKTLITGCVAQIERDKLLDYDFIDYVLGNDEKLNIVEFLQKNEDCEVGDIMNMTDFHEAVLIDTTKTRASLKIQDGCDNRCAYCIIPFARGNALQKVISLLNKLNLLKNMALKRSFLREFTSDNGAKSGEKLFLTCLKKLKLIRMFVIAWVHFIQTKSQTSF